MFGNLAAFVHGNMFMGLSVRTSGFSYLQKTARYSKRQAEPATSVRQAAR